MTPTTDREAQAEAVSFLKAVVTDPDSYPVGGSYDFLRDLLNKHLKYGDLSDKQVTAVLNVRDRAAQWKQEREERDASAQPFRDGARTIEGTILSTRLQDTGYGETLKCLIDEGDGNRVWGTVPRSLRELTEFTRFYDADGQYQEEAPKVPDLKGQRVRLHATVQQSDRDEHFGFYSRPSGGEVLPA